VDPAWFGGGVAALAAVVVAWQSWETRRNANAALLAAQAANDALELARLEEGHTRTLIAETVKSRIDASTPVVHVQLEDAHWPPVDTLPTGDQSARELPVGTKFIMPRDQNSGIFVRQPVTIVNPNAVSIRLGTNHVIFDSITHRPWNERANDPVVIAPREQRTGYFVIQRSLGEWVEIAAKRDSGEPGPEWMTQFSYVDPADTSAMDTYEIRSGGLPIEPVPQELGGWQIASLRSPTYPWPIFDSGLMPRQRQYWLSRTRDQRLE
jgi:type II secretory pathway pseudopilin PulG